MLKSSSERRASYCGPILHVQHCHVYLLILCFSIPPVLGLANDKPVNLYVHRRAMLAVSVASLYAADRAKKIMQRGYSWEGMQIANANSQHK